ncbi:MAG: hypothetical protein AAGM67_21715, partial [Bacteroidota bacterium]
MGRLTFYSDATYDPCYEDTFKVLSLGVVDNNGHIHLVALTFASDESQYGFAFMMNAVTKATEFLFSSPLSFEIDCVNTPPLLSNPEVTEPVESGYYSADSSNSIRSYFEENTEVQVLFPPVESSSKFQIGLSVAVRLECSEAIVIVSDCAGAVGNGLRSYLRYSGQTLFCWVHVKQAIRAQAQGQKGDGLNKIVLRDDENIEDTKFHENLILSSFMSRLETFRICPYMRAANI